MQCFKNIVFSDLIGWANTWWRSVCLFTCLFVCLLLRCEEEANFNSIREDHPNSSCAFYYHETASTVFKELGQMCPEISFWQARCVCSGGWSHKFAHTYSDMNSCARGPGAWLQQINWLQMNFCCPQAVSTHGYNRQLHELCVFDRMKGKRKIWSYRGHEKSAYCTV